MPRNIIMKSFPAAGTKVETDTPRRRFLKHSLIISAGCFLSSLPLPGLANSIVAGKDPLADFIRVTQLLTEHKHVDPRLAAHFFQVFAQQDRQFASKLQHVLSLSSPNITAIVLMAHAKAAGLSFFLQQIITAWYTGTIGDDYRGTVVSYQQALMYRVVSDGLVVPTYCGNGPLWWTASVPDANNLSVIDDL